MVVTQQGELVVHVDVAPSEQVDDPQDMTTRCMVGLVADSDTGVERLKQYKHTRAKRNRTGKKKAAEARRIVEAVKGGDPSLHVIACAARGAEWYRFGEELLGSLPTRVARPEAAGYRVGRDYVPAATARALGCYAVGLFAMGEGVSRWAEKLGLRKVKMLLDRLPSSDVGNPRELLMRISHHPDIFPIWNEIQTKRGVKFEFGDDWVYRNPGGVDRPGAEHPNSILTDWVARSLATNFDPDLWLAESQARTVEQRQDIGSIFHELHVQKRVQLISLERLTLEPRTGS